MPHAIDTIFQLIPRSGVNSLHTDHRPNSGLSYNRDIDRNTGSMERDSRNKLSRQQQFVFGRTRYNGHIQHKLPVKHRLHSHSLGI